MLETIQEIKEILDCTIVNLTYSKLSSERFGTCFSSLDKNRLGLLIDYQEIIDKLVLQTSPMLPSEETSEVITVVNTHTNESFQKVAYTTVNYLGNCIKEIIKRTPYYNEDTQEIEESLTTEYVQVTDCTNIQSDIFCVEELIAQIKRLV